MAWFSSDRTIREYAEDIWNVPVRPTPLVIESPDVRGARA
jgi:starch phosphorylase